MHWQTRFGDWSPTEGLGGTVVFPLDVEVTVGGHSLTITLPPPPENLRRDKPVAVIDLTGAFDLDTDGHVLDFHPDQATVMWMSWNDWWEKTGR